MRQLVFIVAETETLCSNLFDLFKLEECQVIIVDNSSFALNFIKELKPDFIFCDFKTPDIDGTQIIKALREDKATAKIPFIFLMDSESHDSARQLGASDYLTKPINFLRLKQLMVHQYPVLS